MGVGRTGAMEGRGSPYIRLNGDVRTLDLENVRRIYLHTSSPKADFRGRKTAEEASSASLRRTAGP